MITPLTCDAWALSVRKDQHPQLVSAWSSHYSDSDLIRVGGVSMNATVFTVSSMGALAELAWSTLAAYRREEWPQIECVLTRVDWRYRTAIPIIPYLGFRRAATRTYREADGAIGTVYVGSGTSQHQTRCYIHRAVHQDDPMDDDPMYAVEFQVRRPWARSAPAAGLGLWGVSDVLYAKDGPGRCISQRDVGCTRRCWTRYECGVTCPYYRPLEGRRVQLWVASEGIERLVAYGLWHWEPAHRPFLWIPPRLSQLHELCECWSSDWEALTGWQKTSFGWLDPVPHTDIEWVKVVERPARHQ